MTADGLLIGVDEAGYGPNLGPLTIGLTAWPTDVEAGSLAGIDLYDRLDHVVSRAPAADRLAVADSKALYKPGGGLDALERAALSSMDDAVPVNWNALLDRLAADPQRRRDALPWHDGFNPRLPLVVDRGWLDEARRSLPARLAQARLVFAAEFNELLQRWGSKGAALSHATLELLAGVIQGDTPTFCVCDKHGGRNRYAALLQHHFPDRRVETLSESRAESRYRVGAAEVAFRTGGEAFLPTAWASMLAKYLREVAMRALNAYWAREVPGVRPTAGYPVDAKRFRADIAERQHVLGIDDRVLWRNR